jgi:hypothetical protein
VLVSSGAKRGGADEQVLNEEGSPASKCNNIEDRLSRKKIPTMSPFIEDPLYGF